MTEPRETVLVVDDDRALAKVLKGLLEQDGLVALCAESGDRALAMIDAQVVDVVVTDLRMPGMDGMELLRAVHARWPDLPLIMLTAHGTIPIAVEAMRFGAADFVLKPFDREELLYTVRKALTASRRASEAPPRAATLPGGILGQSSAIKDLTALIQRASAGNATVLVRGESGTGKELVARAIHDESPRRTKPFVKIHCAALPDTLLESELFGYERGAFTGAANQKPGRVELAQGGTLFLDEIGDITPAMQVKLLRLLQDRELERLGSTKTIKIDARFVAATHRNLEPMVERGEFRQDLFYRLSVIPIFVAPLRERQKDIPLLTQHFCAKYGADNHRPDVAITKEGIERLTREPWPGNVRQLQNFIERLVVLSDREEISAADVDRELARGPTSSSLSAAISPAPGPGVSSIGEGVAGTDAAPAPGTLDAQRRETEHGALLDALARAKNNRTVAARILGVSRRTLYNKLEEHGVR